MGHYFLDIQYAGFLSLSLKFCVIFTNTTRMLGLDLDDSLEQRGGVRINSVDRICLEEILMMNESAFTDLQIYNTTQQESGSRYSFFSLLYLVLVLDGNSEIGAHVWSDAGNLICVRH